MSLSRTTGRIATLSLLSVLLALVAYDGRLSPSQSLTGKIFYNCYSCDSTKGECKLELVHETEEIGSPCAALGLGSSCAQACKCPSGTWPCEQNSCLAAFSEYKNWISYQPNIAEGYVGSVYDRDRYLYFVPYKNDYGPQGVVWRYDSRAALNSQPSWGVFDPSSNGLSAAARGFSGGAFDGRYVYFAPNENASGPSGAVMRYDTTKNMAAVTSWELYDPSANGLGANAKGFNGAVFDGNYVYFVPDTKASGGHNDVLRYDVTKPFDSASSWQVFNPKSAASSKNGYAGAIYDGRYVYFVPKGSNKGTTVSDNGALVLGDLLAQESGKPTGSSAMHGDVMRYDTRAPFGTATSWSTFDPSSNGVGSNARGYNGAAFDGTYIYFAPYINSSGPHGEVLRYNTKQSFTTASSWATFNVNTGGVDADAKGYIGAAFDGQFVYFSPYYNGKGFHGKVLRYNTKGTYSDKLSWTVYDIGTAKESAGSAGGKRYQAFTASANINWMDAEASCVSKGGHLASILSQAESDEARAAAQGKTNVWIGLNDRATEGDYKWTSGSAFSFTNWELNQPNGLAIDSGASANDCTFMNHTAETKWHDVGCDDPAFQTPNYLCELPAGTGDACGTVPECTVGTRWNPASCKCETSTQVGNCSAVLVKCPAGKVQDPVTCGCKAASSSPSVPTGGGGAGTMGATGPNGEVADNNVLTVPKGSQVRFTWSCPGSVSVDAYSGFQATNITCQFKRDGATIVSNALQDGATFVTVNNSGNYTFKCNWFMYNSISSYEKIVCDKSTTVNVSTSSAACTRPPECDGRDIDKFWDPVTCRCF